MLIDHSRMKARNEERANSIGLFGFNLRNMKVYKILLCALYVNRKGQLYSYSIEGYLVML
jgi:hypothetical protein